jgi:hypothetical protein
MTERVKPSVHFQAHCSRWQPYFDRNLCYGVQYEIARLVTLGCFRYKDLCTDLLCNLSGPNAEAAPKTAEALAEIFVDGKLKEDAVFSKAVPSKVRDSHVMTASSALTIISSHHGRNLTKVEFHHHLQLLLLIKYSRNRHAVEKRVRRFRL